MEGASQAFGGTQADDDWRKTSSSHGSAASCPKARSDADDEESP